MDAIVIKPKSNTENDKSARHFQSFFFFRPPTLNLKFFLINQLIKKSGLITCKHIFSCRMENSVDPDQMASLEAC